MGKRVLTFLLCFLFASSAFAAEIERASIIYKGTEGIFFSQPVADKVLLDLETFSTQAQRIYLLDTKLELMAEKVLLLEQDIELSDKIAEKYEKNYELEHSLRLSEAEAYEEKLAEKNSFWKSPGVWFGIGFVIAGALAVGLSFSLQTVRN